MEINLLKLCVKCKLYLSVDHFYLKKNGKYHSYCNDCRKTGKKQWDTVNKEHIEEYKIKNKEHIDIQNKEYRENNRDDINRRARENSGKYKPYRDNYWEIPENKQRRLINQRISREKNRDTYNAYFPEYHKRKPSAKLAHLTRTQINKALNGSIKHFNSQEILGCSFDFFKEHLESFFTDGMDWTNHGFGNDKWNIDHTPPLAFYDHECPLQHAEAFRWYHTRPMWTEPNISKNSNHEGVRYFYKEGK